MKDKRAVWEKESISKMTKDKIKDKLSDNNKEDKKEKKKKKAEIKEVAPEKKKRNKKFLLLYLALAAFLVYASFTIINQSIQIQEKKDEYQKLEEQKAILEIKIEDLKKIKNLKDSELRKYYENIAREDLDYIKNGERVFVNVSGE